MGERCYQQTHVGLSLTEKVFVLSHSHGRDFHSHGRDFHSHGRDFHSHGRDLHTWLRYWNSVL